ncbi:MAG: SMP-30/gluconolactonase/LRE family protein [Novosphingobium sp.]|nr:SMP-30/gluconolactonase/LRE family protein [Novosphingobium sp.]
MEFKALATGYCFLEAPRVLGDDVWFSDLLLGGIYRCSRGGKVEKYLEDRHHVGGLAVNHDGKLICGGPGPIIWFDPATGKSGELLGDIPGESFLGANDFIPDRNGGLCFGTLSKGADYSQEPQLTQLFRLDKSGSVMKLSDGLKFSNGVGFSPDGSKLYHNESLLGTFVYDVAADGSLADKRIFTERTDGDGLAVDAEGGVWIAHFDSTEVARYLPDGTIDQRHALPHKAVSSVAFGGADWRDLYVTTAGDKGIESLFTGELPPREATLFHARCDIPGVPVPETQFTLPD